MSGKLTVDYGIDCGSRQVTGWPTGVGYESLVLLHTDEVGVLAVLVQPDYSMQTLRDWQGEQPRTLAECDGYDWVTVVDGDGNATDGYEGFPVQAVYSAFADAWWDEDFVC